MEERSDITIVDDEYVNDLEANEEDRVDLDLFTLHE
jgi:hypothetical protein